MFGKMGKRLIPALALAATFAGGAAAQAGMIPVSVSVQADGDKFRWTYGVVVTTDVNVNTGDSFTIYDIGGFNPDTVVAPVGWNVATSLVTSAHPGVHPTDNPSVMDITFTYTDAVPILGQSGLGNFSVISDYDTATTTDFTSRAHRQVDGRVEDNITTTDAPAAPGDVDPPINETPEPATLALLALGLPALGLALRSRRSVNRKQ